MGQHIPHPIHALDLKCMTPPKPKRLATRPLTRTAAGKVSTSAAYRETRVNPMNWTPEELQSLVDDHPLVLFMKGSPNQPQCGFPTVHPSAPKPW